MKVAETAAGEEDEALDCSVVFEAESEEKDVMNRPPRKPNAPVL